ncbi:uncharacterized protein LOC134249854, partial [Saccostrea cucullata]|uniref:uncharacterized protein LOC134249854 n=1 Tax=Saccostrea cuccullata TaxID=36930 RepID=UPI002ED56DC2
MQTLVFFVELSSILSIITTEKVSPRQGLKSFREDYDSIAKTCVAVGYVKDNCKHNSDKRNMVIAFNAKTKGGVQTVNKGRTVIFAEVSLNIGRGLKADKGIFIAPISGVCVFDWTTMTNTNKYAHTALYVNGKIKETNHCQNNNHSIQMVCSKMAVVRMETGDEASIKCFYGTSSIYNYYSSFSGFMLYRMQFIGFVVGLSAILGNISSEKVSPKPGLKSFRDDYDSVAKTCVAVGYVKDHCKNNRDRSTKNMVIAFNAKAKGSVQAVSKGNIVMFGDVDLNIGGGFNAVRGDFTAPKSGVYVFDWTILTERNKAAYTALYVK